ncbi:MAG: hypothetical protein JHD07_02365 [Bradyrhizobium sp.]|uniref:hypothetical protein n=1 Tax=Bradyrhizobium TaxID=374 RepID=UPI0011AE9E69|nr:MULTISPECIES: hypothetical protein [Bradyrhizobium]MBJ7402190.1 hypothetical protein [Bradyrhizobium sp.]MBR0926325.1 hypothetical protein [Bradyrhizobium diazoefficiens]
MKSFFVVTLFCFVAAGTASNAQQRLTPVDQLPEGRRISGWLIDQVSYPRRIDAEGAALARSFGSRGAQSISAAPSSLEYLAGRDSNTVQYGRAFLKVDRGGPLTFVVTGDIIDSTVPFTSCEFILRLAGQDILRTQINSRGPGGRERGGPGVGNAVPDPGYYRLEYVISCPYVTRARYTIAVRGETDASPRSFAQSELFHVAP